MRRAVILLGLALLGGCQEPTFDERYSAAEKATRDKAAEIDKELAEREKAESGDGGASGAAQPTP